MKKKILVCLVLLICGIFQCLMAQEGDWFQKGLSATDPYEKIECFTRSIQQNPRWQPFVARANVKFDLADYQGARDDFLEALKYFGTVDSQVKFQLSNDGLLNEQQQGIFNDLAQNNNLKRDLEDWLTDICTRDLFFIYCFLGVTNQCLHNSLDAQKSFSEALEVMPEETAMHWAEFEYSNKYYEISMEEYTEIPPLDSTYINAYFNRGLACLDLQQYDNASADFEKVIELDPENAGAYFYRAKAFYYLGKLDKTIADLTEYLSFAPDSPEVYNLRGKIYLTISKYDPALEDFNKALSLKPDLSEAYSNIGYVCLQQDKSHLAIEYFNKCLSFNDKSVCANVNLAIVYYSLGKKSKAKLYLDTAREMEPDLSEGMDGIAKLAEEGYYWTERDKEMLAEMFVELK